MAQIKLAEFTFDNSVGDAVLYITPTTIVGVNEDVVNGNITTRTVYIDDSTMPTELRFNQSGGGFNLSLLTVEYLNIDSNITTLNMCFYRCQKLQRVNTSNWNTSNVTNFARFCDECSSLVEIDVSHFNVSKANGSFYKMFSGVKAEVLDVSKWNVNTTDGSLSGMFQSCPNVKKLDLSNWKVKLVHTTGTDTSIANMFNGCSSLEYLDLSGFDFSEMNASMTYMFKDCSSLRGIKGIENFDVSKVTNFSFMFQNCSSLTKLNLRNWVTSSATTMQGMFHSCTSLTEIKGIENFDVSKVTTFGAMFYCCSSLTKLDLRNWVTSSATTFQDMFASCHNLEVIRVDNFDTSKVTGTGLNAMFSDCKKVKTLNLNSFVNAGLGNFLNFCYKCESLEYISAQNFIWGNFNSAQGLFTNCKSLKYLDFTTFDGSNITTATVSLRLGNSLEGVTCPIYYNSNTCTANDTALTGLSNAVDVKGRLMAVYDFNNSETGTNIPTLTGSTITKTIDTQDSESYITHRVIGVDVMPTAISFKSIRGLLNVDYLAVTSSCTSLASLFENCFRMTYVNTFGWDTSNVTRFGYCFRTCNSLTEIRNIQDLKVTSKVTEAYDFFNDCSKLTSLDLTHWDVSGVKNGSVMFRNCSGLTSLNISNWDVSSMQYGNSMFQGCTSLSELDLTSFKTTTMESDNYNMFDSWTSDQIVYIHDTNWTIDVSSYNATFVRRLSTLLARYTFNNSVSDCLPKFNNTILPSSPNYKISDMVNGTVTTRLISVDDEALLPTRIHFSDDGYTAGRSILSCDYLNTSNCTSLHLLFYGCNKLTYVNTSSWNTSKVESFEYAFRGTQITTLDTTNIDVSSAINLRGMFDSCSRITSLDLSSWNVSKTRTFSLLFLGCSNLTTLDISTWDTSNADNMSDMFNNVGITELDLSHFITSKVTNMSNMFSGCKIQNLDLSSWDVSKVSNVGLMFYSNAIKEINVDGWNTENFTNMYGMFCLCGISKIDISHFKTSKVTNMSQLFDRCYNLTSVGDLSNWDTSNVTNMNSMFSGCTKLTELNVAGWDTRKVTSFSSIFNNWTSDQTVYYEPPFWSIGTTTLNSNINWVINITRNNGYWLDMTGITGATEITLFNENNLATEEILTDWGDGTQNSELTHTYSTAGEYIVVSNLQLGQNNNNVNAYLTKATIYYLTKPYAMFYSCSKLTDVTLTDNWVELFNVLNEANGYTCDSMFYCCKKLSTLDTTQICKMKNITSMKYMFSDCSSLVELDLGGFDSAKVTSLQNTFSGCSSLTSLNLDGLDLSSVTTMASMCNNCYGLTTFTPPKNNTNSLKILQDTFRNTRLLNYDFLNDWNLDQVTSFSSCLHSCAKMTSFSFKNKHLPSTTNLQYMFDGCTNLQTVDLSGLTVDNKVGMLEMFSGCKSLTSANFSNSAIKPTTCANMFHNCSSLISLDLSSWDVSQCTNMGNMFNGCKKLEHINLLSWDTSKAIMPAMFSNCSSLTELDLSSFTTNSVPNFSQMFNNCEKLESLDISNFKVDNTDNIVYMFDNCPLLKKVGLLYADSSTINNIMKTNIVSSSPVIYYYDADPSQLTPVEGVTFKKYSIPTTIQLPPHIQLHSLPDGTRDEVDIKTGILTQRVAFLDLSTIETWGKYDVMIFTGNLPLEGKTPSEPFAATGVVSNPYYENTGWHTAVIYGNNATKPYIAINATSVALNFRTTEFTTPQEMLAYQPVSIFYELAEPVTTKLILNYNNSCDYGRILPTGMCDKYDVVNSMYTQTMASILLDGENTWDAMEEMTNVVKFTATGTTVGIEELNMLGAGGLYCDNDLFPNINDDSDVEHCRVDEAGNKFYIYISKDRLMSPDLIGYQIWLQENNFNLIYELAEHLTYVKPYEELDATQARWEGMDCMRDGAIKYHTNSSDNITMYPTLEYVAPSINNFEVTMLEPNTDYTIYAEGINKNDTINLGGTDINFNNGTVYTSGDNQWLRIDNNDSFYNMVITKGDTTGEVVPYFEGMTSVENPKVITPTKNLALIKKDEYNVPDSEVNVNVKNDGKIYLMGNAGSSYVTWDLTTGERIYSNAFHDLRTLQLEPGTYTITSTLDASQATGLSQGYTISLIVCADGKYVHNHNGYYITNTNNFEQKVLKTTVTVENYFSCITMQRWYTGSCDGIVASIQIEKGNTATIFAPAGGSTVSYTDLKLRSLPNGVKDTINVVTGEYVQRVGEIVFDGSENWSLLGANQGIYSFSIQNTLTNVARPPQNSVNFICDKLLPYPYEKVASDIIQLYPYSNYDFIIKSTSIIDKQKFKEWLAQNPTTVQYELAEPIITKLDPQALLAYTDGTINLSSDTGLLPTTHYTVPSTNTFHLPSMKTGTRYTLKYPSASGSITIGDINYSISSDSMLFTTPLKINGDTSAIIFSDANPENVVLLEGAYNKREVPFFTGVKSVKNPNITIIDQLSTESTTYNCETEIELRGLPNGVADKLDIIKGKLTTNVGIRPYQEGDENLPNIWTDGYETVYALSSPVVTNVTIDRPTVTTNSLIELSSDYLIPQLNYRAPSSNNFPLDLLQPNTTYTLYADTLTSGSYTLGGTRTGVYSQPHTIILGDITDNLLTFNGDLGLSNVMLVKGNSLKTTLPPYFLGIRSVTDGHLLVEGMAGEINELTFDEGIVLRDCNGVKDTIDLITCTLTKRTGEITLTGAEGWYRADNESTTDHNVFKLTLGGLKEALVMCDTLQSVFDTKMMDCIHAHTNELCIVIANATIGGDTVNALKSWLNQHPTTVVYQLRVPIEVQLENTWTTLPPTSYSNQTEISSTVSTNSLKPMISVTIATTTLEEIVSNLEAQNAQLEEENMATMLALTSVYETMAAPMAASTMSLDNEPSTVNLSDGKDGNNINGMSVSPIGMVYVNLIRKGLKTIEQVPYNLQPEVMYALRGME